MIIKLRKMANNRGGVEDTRLEVKDIKISEAKAKDNPTEDRPSRGLEQKRSRPRPRAKDTSASALQKKKVFRKFFQAISRKNRFPKNFSGVPQTFNNSKNSANFRGLEASRPRTSKCVLEAKDILEDSTSGK